LEPDVPLFRLPLVFAYVELGRPAEAEAVAREGGDTSRVARAIRRGLGESGFPDLLGARSLRGLRTDPRWAEIVREVRGR
jgi:hypothetical protein